MAGSASPMHVARIVLAGVLAGALGTPVFAQAAPDTAANTGAAALPTRVLEEITVTARKKDESAIAVPASISAFSEATIENLNIQTFTDYATKTPNMTFSYGTANWGYVDSHTVAIRGITGFGTTGVYIDETPVPDSLDPRVVDIARIEILKGPQGTLFGASSLGGNLRLITVQPTPGRSDAHYSVKIGETRGAGSPDYALDFAGSTDIGKGVTGRAVVFYDHEGGFLKRVATDPVSGAQTASVGNYGAQKTYGGSLSLRIQPGERLDATLRLMAQASESDGWSAPYAPLPGFSVNTLTMDRTNNVQEMAKDTFTLPSLQVNYSGDGWSLHESLSHFNRIGRQVEDGSEGTRDALVGDWFFPGVTGIAGAGGLYNQWAYFAVPQGTVASPFAWYERVAYTRTASETRLNFDKTSGGLSGVTGLYIAKSFSDTYLDGGNNPIIQSLGLNTNANAIAASQYYYGISMPYCRNLANPGDTSCPTYGSGLSWQSTQPSYHYDQAVFGELYQEFGNFELTVGGRFYRQRQTTHEYAAGALNFSYLDMRTPDTSQSGFNPKLALKYAFDPTAMVYASYSKGFRAGGAGVPLPIGPAAFFSAIKQQPNMPTTYTTDYVKNYEIGGKLESADHRYMLTGALFQMDWSNIQQTIIAPVSYITMIVNAGDARVRGGEIEFEARPLTGLELHAGLGYEDAKITNGVLYWQPTGADVYNTPKITANLSGTYTRPVTERMSAYLTIDGSHVSSSVSGTAGCQLNTTAVQYFPCPAVNAAAGNYQGWPIERAGYSVLNLRVGLDLGQSDLALYLQNITNAHPNLGDFNPESYAKHSTNPADLAPYYGTGYVVPRVATLRPFNVGLTWRHRF